MQVKKLRWRFLAEVRTAGYEGWIRHYMALGRRPAENDFEILNFTGQAVLV